MTRILSNPGTNAPVPYYTATGPTQNVIRPSGNGGEYSSAVSDSDNNVSMYDSDVPGPIPAGRM
jgi:hypothetical protein